MSDVVPLLKFTPSAQDPAILETITVQREHLVAALVDSALDTQAGNRHHLLVGPRGMGKTHILSLVANRVRAAQGHNASVIVAWLDEDPWAIRTYDKFLAAIVARVSAETGDSELARKAATLRSSSEKSDGLEGEELLRTALDGRRLVLLVENLDDVFRRIGSGGQARLRAFAEDWQQLLILATTPQLFAGIQRHTSPFYGFFAITHLDELSLESAKELLQQIARLRGDADLDQFLDTDTAASRLTAVEALAGGHPRVWLLLAGCISIAAIDELVPLFLEALDDLTPYYQDRLRELGDQQQELIVLLSEAGGALSNRALAERSGIAQNQIASMLRQLTDRGYVRRAQLPRDLASGDRRMSYWELREPLMRLCLDVKQARSGPLRMVVEFLRAWYGTKLLDELGRLPASAQLAARYVNEAFLGLGGPRAAEALLRGSPHEVVARAERGLSRLPEDLPLQITRAVGLINEQRFTDARANLEQMLVSTEPSTFNYVALRVLHARALRGLNQPVESDELISVALEMCHREPNDATAAGVLALCYELGGHKTEALAARVRASELDPDEAHLHYDVGLALHDMGRHEEAEQATRRAVELDDQRPDYRFTLAAIVLDRGDYENALLLLHEALEVWSHARTESSEGTDLLCKILWSRLQGDPRRAQIIEQFVLAYSTVGCLRLLSRGVVLTIPLFTAKGVSQSAADAWVEDWTNAASVPEFEIPVNMLEAARAWKHRGDRVHLLTLPSEQREILFVLLSSHSSDLDE